MQRIINHINKLAELGYDESLSPIEQRQLYITNWSLIFSIVNILIVNILYIILDFQLFILPELFIFILMPSIALGLYFNKTKKYELAKHTLLISIMMIVAVAVFFLYGKDSGLQIFFLQFALMAIFIFPLRRYKIILFYFILCISLYMYISFGVNEPMGMITFTPELSKISRITNIFVLLFSFSSVLMLSQKMMEKNEDQLKVLNNDLHQKNLELENEIRNSTQLQNDLKKSDDLYRGLLNTIPDMVIMTDLEGNLEYFSPNVTNLVGNSYSYSLLRKNIISFTSDEDREAFKKHIKELPDHYYGAMDYRFVLPNEEVIDVEVKGEVIRDYDWNAQKLIFVMRDITDRKQAENEIKELLKEVTAAKETIENALLEKTNLIEALENAKHKLEKTNIEKDRFFSILAHDLRNPFGAFKDSLSLLTKEYESLSDEEILTYIISVNNSSKLVYELLENLLTWSQNQRGVLGYHPDTFSLAYIVKNTLELLSVNAEKKAITFVSEVPDNAFVFADLNMIKTVIRNLVSNAIKFTPEKGKIEVFTSQKDDFTLVNIRDNGVGIPAENLSKMFRIDVSFTTNGTNAEKGTGLGLILCKDFVEKNGGEISVSSEPGKGTTFSFSIPKFPPVS